MMSHNLLLLKRSWPVLVQAAQAHRKPRWLPVAKSKIYRIPKRPEVSEEERLELLRINNNYKTQMRAVRRFLHEEMIKEKSTFESASSELSVQQEQAEWQRCVAENERWNAGVAAERDARRRDASERAGQHALRRMHDMDAAARDRVARAAALIKQEKDLSASFITPENIDEAIERALANPVDFNFSIDLKGTQNFGREPVLPPTDGNKQAPVTV